jgi:hypothetical protein
MISILVSSFRQLALPRTLLLAAILVLPSAASAAPIYIDYLTTGGNGPPSSSFGAAFGVPGQWNDLDFSEVNSPVFDIFGAATGVTVTNSAGGQAVDHPSTSGDVASLLDDGLDSGNQFTITISGLPAGQYDIYTYSWHPSDAGDQTATTITVNGMSPQLVERAGGFTGFALGETHALHTVSIGAGQDIVILAEASGDIPAAILNGLQIVPEPSTAILCAAAALCLATACWRRRGR